MFGPKVVVQSQWERPPGGRKALANRRSQGAHDVKDVVTVLNHRQRPEWFIVHPLTLHPRGFFRELAPCPSQILSTFIHMLPQHLRGARDSRS